MGRAAPGSNDAGPSGSNLAPVVLTGLCAVLVIGFLYNFYVRPVIGIGPEQPIPFSHRLHAGVKEIRCRFCHPYVGYAGSPGMPPVEKCLYCHEYIINKHPAILKEHRYLNMETPTPWVKVFHVPEHVLFNHQRHVQKDVVCRKCHGDVEGKDRLRGNVFKMGFCVNCHRDEGANLDCWLACHS